ncbi:protein SCAF11 isoform X2 [Xiphias gladius]|uniref:protein SCAF11 isoform X2 n=1 Tax=Xiphias gladius TaxID=8245 RepID=UPI001A981EFA|nr:protein SCAF11 isoform X2 [Xiphias gladius]
MACSSVSCTNRPSKDTGILFRGDQDSPGPDMTRTGSGSPGLPDEMDAEEAERCPICLGVLAGCELAMPDSCCHVFCLRCLLTWAEMAPSCPIDRRPFTNVYRWDGNFSCVQVPMSKRAIQLEAESCCCRNPRQKVCLNKPARRLRWQKVERMAEAKTKRLVRKCNDEDPSSLSRKKVRGTECCTWSPSPCVSLTTTSTQDIVEPVWVTEDIQYDTGFKQCKPQVQDCPWLSPATPIPANGTTRQSFHPANWNHSPFPFGLCSSPFTSGSLLSHGHFGGEKKSSRASTSKAPAKEAESLPPRRSGRNGKTQEETPASDPSSLPQSSSSDSDSSTNQSTKPAKTSQMPTKRKGKQVTNRKASGKRKATTRKKRSTEFISSPAANEEEEVGEGPDNRMEGGGGEEEEEDKTDKEQDTNNSEQQQSDAEGSLNADQDGLNSADEQGSAESLSNDVGQESDETQEQSNEHEQEKKQDDGDDDRSCPSDLAHNNHGSCFEGDHSKREEEEQASPVSSGDKDSEKRTSPSPSESQNALLEDLMSPHCDEQTEQDDETEVCAESEEANFEQSSNEVKAESCENLRKPGSPSAGGSEENVADPETKASEDTNTKMLGSEEPSVVDSFEEGKKDDTNVVPMDCSLTINEQGNNPILELPKESADPAATGPPLSESQVAKDKRCKDQQETEKSQERKNGRQRHSRFHSPTSTWSPKMDSKREPTRRSRSRSRECDSSRPFSHSSRARSRERDRDRDCERDYSRRDRSRERRRWRSRSRSKSRSCSRSRSRSRTRSYRRGASPEWPGSREQSPQRRERRGGWRSGQGSSSGGEGRRYHGGAGRFENGVPPEGSPERQGWSDNPDWVTEKTRGEAEGRNRDFGFSGGSRWEDHRTSGGNRAEPRGRGRLERGRGAGRGGGNRSFYKQQEETADNRWQPRNSFSGTGNNSGSDAYSRFNENRGGGRRKESEPGDSMLDRSGWSSASSWAVRRTLPADVQDYYSKRERGGSGGWNRQEEEQQQSAAADPPKSEPPPQAVLGNAPVPVMNVIPPHPPQLNVLHHHYPMQGPRGALPVSLQPAAPYAMPPQVPLHLHPAVPLLQVPAVGAQSLPPPPPPPPPMQQGSQTAAAQPDGYMTQMTSTMVGYGKCTLLPTPTKAVVVTATQGQPAPTQVIPSSTTQPGHNKAQADSSKKEKKQQIQEKAINEVKTAIKPFYQKKEITKEEYKEIVRKAVEKVCHSKSGEVNSNKVANLVKAYVDKYKHARKK